MPNNWSFQKKIYKSFLVTGFDSGMIADAILLRKKIIGFVSDFMSNNEISHSTFCAKQAGYLLLNTKNDYFFDKDKILRQMNQNLNNYDKYKKMILGNIVLIKTFNKKLLSDMFCISSTKNALDVKYLN